MIFSARIQRNLKNSGVRIQLGFEIRDQMSKVIFQSARQTELSVFKLKLLWPEQARRGGL